MSEVFDIKAPTSWGQVSKSQLLAVAALIDAKLDRDTLLLVLFCRLSGLSIINDGDRPVFTDGRRRFRLKPYELRQFCDSVAFIIDERPSGVPNPTKVSGHLIDVRFGDYFQADALVDQYERSGDTRLIKRALRRLGDRRLLLSKVMANAVMLWWFGVRSFLKDRYPNVFADSQGDGPQKSSYEVLQDILLMLNDNRPQDNRLIEDSDVHSVLSALNNKIDMSKRQAEIFKT